MKVVPGVFSGGHPGVHQSHLGGHRGPPGGEGGHRGLAPGSGVLHVGCCSPGQPQALHASISRVVICRQERFIKVGHHFPSRQHFHKFNLMISSIVLRFLCFHQ